MRESSYMTKRNSHTPNDIRGGEKKVMKKGLSLLLAASMAFSAFSSAAMAAELTAQEKFDALVEAGIFTGYPDGSAGLDRDMTRAEVATVVFRLLDLQQDAAGAAAYTDLVGAEWAAGYIGAITPEYMEGYGNGKFGPSDKFTYEQLATVLVRVLDLDVEAGATVEGEVSEWAAANVAAAVKAGVLVAQSDYTKPAVREALVGSAYVANEQLNPVKEVVTLAASQAGAKKIALSFGAAVDTAKAVISVKNGNNTVNVQKKTWAEDNKSVTLEFAHNLTAADYAISVSGISEAALSATVKVEASKVSGIEFASDKLVVNRANPDQATISYKIVNQFGEDVTTGNTIKVTQSYGGAAVSGGENVTGGKITIDNTGTTALTLDSKVILTALHVDTSTFVSTTATVVAPSKIASIDLVKLAHADGKVLQQGATAGDFSIELDLKDQYGNALTDAAFLDAYWTQDIVVSVAGNSATFAAKPTVTNGKAELKLATIGTGVNYGKTILTAVSLATGSRDSIELDVKQAATVDTLTLTAPAIAAKGDTVEIAFTAVDQFGAEVKHLTNDDITLNVSGNDDGAATATWTRDYVKDTTKLSLVIDEGAANTIVITGVTKTGKFVQLQFNTVAKRVPTAIAGVKGITSLLADASKNLTVGDNVIVNDQYGSEIKSLAGGYKVKLEENSDVIYLNGVEATKDVTLADRTTAVTVNAKKKGTASVTLSLIDAENKVVANSSYSFDINVVEKKDITTYEATVTGVVYDDGVRATYGKDLKVEGVLADGSKVTVPFSAANYKIDVTGGVNLNVADGKISSNGIIADNASAQEKDVTLVVTVFGASNPQIIPVTVKVSNHKPEVTTLSVVNNGIAELISENYVAVARNTINAAGGIEALVDAAVKAVDQYGQELKDGNEPNYTIYVSNATGGRAPGDDAAGNLNVQDVFNVTAITSNGKAIAFKVFVK